jgi:DNA-binding CsgD family transcriptional regulator
MSVFSKRGYCFASGTIVVGLLLALLRPLLGSWELPLTLAAGAFCGFGTVFIQVAFLVKITYCERSKPGLQVLAGFLLGNGISLILTYIPFPWATAIVFALCFVSLYCILKGGAGEKTQPKMEKEASLENGQQPLKPALLAILGPTLCAFALEAVFVLVSQIPLLRIMGFNDANHVFILMMLLSSLVIFCIFLVHPINSDPTSLYRIAYPLIATGLVFLPIISDPYSVTLTLFLMLASHAANIIAFLTVVETARKYRINASLLAGITLGAIQGAVLIGVIVGSWLVVGDFLEPVRYLLITVASLYILSMIALFFIRLQKKEPAIQQTANQSENQSEGQTVEEILLARNQQFAKKYGFTRRETDIFTYLINGRTSLYISKTLFLSQNTVKGHLKNIYSKADVHTKQELIDRYENETKQRHTSR